MKWYFRYSSTICHVRRGIFTSLMQFQWALLGSSEILSSISWLPNNEFHLKYNYMRAGPKNTFRFSQIIKYGNLSQPKLIKSNHIHLFSLIQKGLKQPILVKILVFGFFQRRIRIFLIIYNINQQFTSSGDIFLRFLIIISSEIRIMTSNWIICNL